MVSEARPPVLIRQLVDDRYLLGEPIRSGAYGTVYEATRVADKSVCALELLHPELDMSPEAVGRFEALLHGSARGRIAPPPAHSHGPTATDSGIPRVLILLSTFTAIIASLFCASGFLDRSASPTIRLYRNIPFSARAC